MNTTDESNNNFWQRRVGYVIFSVIMALIITITLINIFSFLSLKSVHNNNIVFAQGETSETPTSTDTQTETSTSTQTQTYTNTTSTPPTNTPIPTSTIPPSSVDLEVKKFLYPTNPLEGGLITYTLIVTNNGPITATKVKLTDTLPSDITYIPSSSIIPAGQSYNPSTGLWNIGTLGNGGSITLTLVSRVNLATIGKTITNTVSGLTSDLPDYNPSNNTASVSFTVTGAPDLQIYKTDYQTSISPSDEFTYTFFITNAGSTAASGIIITDILPTHLNYITDSLSTLGIAYVTSTSKTYGWHYPYTINSGKSITFTLAVEAASTMSGSSQINTAKISTTTSEGNISNNSTTDTDNIIYAPSISFSKSVSPSEAAAGSNFTFYIYVTNNSTASVTDVTVKDTFPSSLTINSVSTTRGSASYKSNTRVVTVNIGTLASYASATITISCKVNSSSTSTTYLTNYAYLSYDFSDDSFDKTASVSYRITGGSSLPSTGGVEPGIIGPPLAFSAGVWLAIACCILLFIAGIVLMVYWRKLSSKQSEWAGWCLRMGSVMIGVSICFGAAAWGLSNITKSPTPQAVEPVMEATPMISSIRPVFIPPADDELEFLPEYPVPTPSFVPSLESTEQVVDDSPPNRLMIPDLGVDTVIKYVPYDGFTWLISGLKQEVAWLGDTSWPGLGGNTGLAGHVTLFNGENGPFRFLDQLGVGSPITLFTDKNIYTYKVRQSIVVDASQMSVLEPSAQPSLTLITCTNWDTTAGYYLNRYIVYADLDTTVPIGGNISGN